MRRPPRSRKYVATFTGPEGGQINRSTGLEDRDAALALAHKWEAEARQEKKQEQPSRKAFIRARGGMTQGEEARIMAMSERAVRNIEKRALAKLRKHPLIREVWAELTGEELEESRVELTRAEKQALLRLAQTPEERRVVRKLIRLLDVD